MTEDSLTFDDLALIAAGHSAFKLLWAGVELGVFDQLHEHPGLPPHQLSEAIGLAAQPGKILLRGLATLRLIVPDSSGGFRNNHIVEELLVRHNPGNMVNVLGWQNYIVYPGEEDFVESLRRHSNVGLRRFPGDGDDIYRRLRHSPELEKVFHEAMSALSRSANHYLVQYLDLQGTEHMVDAGGGDGTNAIALARAHSHLRLTVFDGPSVCERAVTNIARAGLAERIATHPGDFFADPFPEDMDSILFAHMLTIWSPEQDTALLRRAYEALPPGGRVFIFNMMAHDDGIGPITAALGSPYFLSIATGEGMLYTWSEYESFLQAAGFEVGARHALPRDHGVLIGRK